MEDVDRAKARLDGVFSAYPRARGGELLFDADGEGFTITCAFGPGDLGRAAALAVDFIAARVGATVETGEESTRVRCSATEFVRFQHYLYYGSELQVARRPAVRLTRTPLPTLLGRALGTFTSDYDRARGEDGVIPQLPAWANVLRVIDAEGTDQNDIVRRAVVAKRIARIGVQRLERRGRLVVEARSVPGKRGQGEDRHVDGRRRCGAGGRGKAGGDLAGRVAPTLRRRCHRPPARRPCKRRQPAPDRVAAPRHRLRRGRPERHRR